MLKVNLSNEKASCSLKADLSGKRPRLVVVDEEELVVIAAGLPFLPLATASVPSEHYIFVLTLKSVFIVCYDHFT